MERIKRVTLYEEVASRIHSFIKEENLLPGTRLPGERELAYRLGVSRSSVREALRILGHSGLIRVQHGEGSFVTGVVPEALGEVSSWAMDIDTEYATMFEIQQVRRILEIEAIKVTTVKASQAVLDKLADIIAATEQKVSVGVIAIEEDLAFHHLIVRTAGNNVVNRIYESVIDLLIEVRKAGLRNPGASNVAVSHAAILKAIESRDPEKAARAMEEHLAKVETELKARFNLLQ